MSYFVAYLTDAERPVDGDQIASGKGWLAWIDWVIERHEDYPCAAHLAEEGWVEPAEAIETLEAELAEMAKAAPGDLKHITRALLTEVQDRPESTSGIVVTDGTAE